MLSTMEKLPTSLIPNGNPHQACIDACGKCAQICEECLNMCLQEADVKARLNCIKSLQDCAEICGVASCFMSRSSGSIKDICNLCATICERCSAECGMFKDQHCKACSDTCLQCATECRKMVGM